MVQSYNSLTNMFITNWRNIINRYIWITALLVIHVQCETDLFKSNKLIIGSLIEMDYWSLYRLPNQSTVCNQFINSYYLDDLKEDGRSVPLSKSSLSSGISSSSTSSSSIPTSSSSSSSSSSTSSSLSGSTNLRDRNNPTNWVDTIEFDPIGIGGLMQLPKQEKSHLFDYNQRLKTVLRNRQPTLFTFTSPLYPDNYPPNTDCIKVIKAPQKDQQIILDFRGPFQFEPSADCINDYLEVRDGEYGFSPLIGRFCSDNRQLHSIKSTGQWLRLRFHSDFSIEKAGFQAVYYFSKLRNIDEPLPQKPIVTTTIIIDNEMIFETKDLIKLWNDYTETLIKTKSHPVDRLIEVIIDFRTNQSDLMLMIHLKFVKFQFIDPECKNNLIEIYDEFFLSNRDTILPIPSVLLKRSKVQIPINEQFTPRVLKACNQPYLEPFIHKLGRSIVRILISPEIRTTESIEYGHMNISKPITKLPEIKIIITALKKAFCENDWVPCVRPTDYVAYKEYFNLTVRSKSRDKQINSDHNNNDNDKQNNKFSKLQTTTPLTMTTIKSNEMITNPIVLKHHSTLPKIIYCLSPNLICNNRINCPNGEDEEMCPRPPGGLEAFDIPVHKHDSIDDLNIQTTEQTSTTRKIDSLSSTSEDDDEFRHHTPIIAGLLGFCAICGLISAGMTLVNRSKKQKHPNFGSVCNSILFESGTSLITALESSGSLSNFKTLQINDFKCENLNFVDNLNQKTQCNEVPFNVSSVTTIGTFVSKTTLTTTTTNVTGTLKKEDNKPSETSCKCTYFSCTNLCSNNTSTIPTLNKQTTLTIDDNDDDNGVDDVEDQEQTSDIDNVIKYDLKSTTTGLAEIFDRATKPLGYIHKLDSSPAWNQSINYHSNTIHQLREVQKKKPTYNSFNLYEYPTNRSLGQLPNTLVIPVAKLSKGSHSPTVKQQTTPKPYYKSEVSRSDPFSLKEQSKFHETNDGRSHWDEHLKFDNLRRSFSVRPIKTNNSAFTPYISCTSLKQKILPNELLELNLNDKNNLKTYYQPRYSLEQQLNSDINIFSILNTEHQQQQQHQSQQWKREQKRKHFKGIAPKRAKHENNFMFQEQSQLRNIPLHQRIGIPQKDLSQYTQEPHSTPRELFTLNKLSQFTNGELLDMENENYPHHYKLSKKEIKHILPSLTNMTMMKPTTTTVSVTPVTSTTNNIMSNVRYHHTKLYHPHVVVPPSTALPSSSSPSNWIIIPNQKQRDNQKQNCHHGGDESSSCISQNDNESETTSDGNDLRQQNSKFKYKILPRGIDQSMDPMKTIRKSAKRMKYYESDSANIDQDSISRELLNNNVARKNSSPTTHSLITSTTNINNNICKPIFENLHLFESSSDIFQCNCKLSSNSKYHFPSSYSVIDGTLSDVKTRDGNAGGSIVRKNASWNDMSYKNEYLCYHDDDDVEEDDEEDDDELDEQTNGNTEQSSEVDDSSVERVEDPNGFINLQDNQLPDATLSPDSSTSEESQCQLNMSSHTTPMRRSHETAVVIITSKGRTVQSTKTT
uniref:CUB domain-containing protein n=1 Tax=Schistosoma mansoni TaxID=6183 RepID=A0A5K4FEK0_SCHMA